MVRDESAYKDFSGDSADDPPAVFNEFADRLDQLATLKQIVGMIERGEWNIDNLSIASNNVVKAVRSIDGQTMARAAGDFGTLEIEMKLRVGSRFNPNDDEYPETPSKPNESLSPAAGVQARKLIFDDDDFERGK